MNPETSCCRSVGFRYHGGDTGMITAPSRERRSICSSAMPESGVSRTHTINRMRSLSATAAARVTSVSAMPVATLASVLTLQGRMIMASCRLLPELHGAARSSSR